MAPDVEEAVARILAVDDADERAVVLNLIEASLHRGEKSPAGSAWAAEIESRMDEILSSKVELVDADETYRLLSTELAALHE